MRLAVGKVIRPRLLAVAGLAAAAVLAPAGAALAATASGAQYGPPPVVQPAPPGGFTTVVTTETICQQGGTIGPVPVSGGNVTVVVPAGAFAECVTITITAPDLSTITPQPGHTVVTGAGVVVGLNGSLFPGTFLMPLTATFTSPGITAGSDVTVWNGSAFVTAPGATVTAGVASVSFDSDPDFAVQSPNAVAPAPVPGGTVPVTGVPVAGEGALAGVLVLGGAAGLAVAARRRRVPGRARD